MSILKDVPIQMGKFIIPYDFTIKDVDESSRVLIILGKSFLTTAWAVINVQAEIMSFQFCGERVDFCFPPPIPPSVPIPHSLPEAPIYSVSHVAVSSVIVFNGDSGPHMRPIVLPNPPPPIPTTHGAITFHPGEVLAVTPFITIPSPPSSILPSFANLR